MEEKDRNPRRGSVDTPRLPAKIKKTQDIKEILKKISDAMSDEARREIAEELFFYTTTKYLGVHDILLQCGELIVTDERGNPMRDSAGKELKKQYFYAGNHILAKEVKVEYEELPQQDKMLYDVVITKVCS